METLRRIVYVILRPSAEWELIAAEPTTVDLLLRRYILPLSLLAPVASAIGMTVFDREWDPAHGYLVPPSEIFAAAAATYFATIASIFILAGIFALLAPMYGATRDYLAALKVATYGAIPVLVAGMTLLLPVMALIGLVAVCHSAYLFWIGARRVLMINDRDRTEYVGISLLLLGVTSTALGAAASGVGLL
jgi:hypothetical protein